MSIPAPSPLVRHCLQAIAGSLQQLAQTPYYLFHNIPIYHTDKVLRSKYGNVDIRNTHIW